MKYGILLVATATVIMSSSAHAQGIPDGIAHGAYVGNNTAGPIGAVVGGAVGGVLGGIEGALGIGPQYAAYPVEAAPVYHHAYHPRHSYWRARPRYSHG